MALEYATERQIHSPLQIQNIDQLSKNMTLHLCCIDNGQVTEKTGTLVSFVRVGGRRNYFKFQEIGTTNRYRVSIQEYGVIAFYDGTWSLNKWLEKV